MDGKRGAPEGNQYARKHGFYSPVLSEEEQRQFEEAIEVEGLDEEIALLRVKITSLINHDPKNIRLIVQAFNTLERMIKAKYNISHEDKQGIIEAVGTVLKGVALPLGISFGSKLFK